MRRARLDLQALQGLRVEVPRWARADVPLAFDLTAKLVGTGRGRGGVPGIGGGGYLPPGLIDDGAGGGGGGGSGGGVVPPDGGAVPPVEIPPGGGGGGAGGVSPGGGSGGAGAAIAARRVVNFHLTEDTSGGASASELRVYGPIVRAFRIAELVVAASAPVTSGQFVDVLISSDADPTDSALPTGSSIFPAVAGQGSLTSPDGEVALPLVGAPFHLFDVFEVPAAGMSVKVRNYFVAPAVALADVHVMLVVDELVDVPVVVDPRPPLPPPVGGGGAPPVVGTVGPLSGLTTYVPTFGQVWLPASSPLYGGTYLGVSAGGPTGIEQRYRLAGGAVVGVPWDLGRGGFVGAPVPVGA